MYHLDLTDHRPLGPVVLLYFTSFGEQVNPRKFSRLGVRIAPILGIKLNHMLQNLVSLEKLRLADCK